MKTLEEIMKELPPELQKEVCDFAEFLLEKTKGAKKGRKLSLSWAGGLSEYKNMYTSLELQKKSLEWRDEDFNKYKGK
jgi:hypothetical protein